MHGEVKFTSKIMKLYMVKKRHVFLYLGSPCVVVSFQNSAYLPWSGGEKRGGCESGESMNRAPVRVLNICPAMKRKVHNEE